MKGIFLGYSQAGMQDNRTELFHVILKAGLHAFPSNIDYNNDLLSIRNQIESAECAVILLGNQYGENIKGHNFSISRYQYTECRKKCLSNPEFKLIIWHPSFFENMDFEPLQTDFLTEIRNDIIGNISFTNINSPIQLVADLRLSLQEEKIEKFDVKATDIFVTYNELDETEAENIIDMLSDIVPVEKLNIIQDSGNDYLEMCKQQLDKSKLAVVYFKESADWALPFTQQIWKKAGGASSHTPILLIGDDDPDTNSNKKFKAPKVVSLIVAGELIPLEIKIQYDKIIKTVF